MTKHEQFTQDMEDAGFETEHYRGRFYWEGPAVRVDCRAAFQEIMQATDVPLQWDDLGLGWIVYPAAGR